MDKIRTSKVDNVRLLDPLRKSKAAIGTLHITATHTIFVDPLGAKETWILHSHIASVERLPLTAAGSPLKIRCKTFQVVTFVISRDRDCADVLGSLLELSSPVRIQDLYAFHYSPKEDQLVQSAGWQLYDAVTEFRRMGVTGNLWRETKLNKGYKLCDTYPEVLFVPASCNDSTVVGSAQFRSRNRLPALSYFHEKTKSALARCAQPLAGLNTRCPEDEDICQAIITSNPETSSMYIIDTRPKINAMANRAAGKGYENEDNYENVKFHFIGIENIHVMRQSLQKMLEVIESKSSSTTSFLTGLENSGWLKHIRAIIDTSAFIAKAIDQEKCNVLVHCSDGWDRTAQTCSLASILLDPYYRTIHGFQVLVEKEWLSFGHKFIHRCGLMQGDPKEVSPIFTQFIDSVWQVMQLYPTAFQFNERFLLTLHDHIYSCQFGTFLGNCDKDRMEQRLPERTFSLWGYMWQRISEYINPFYKDGSHSTLLPPTAPQIISLWTSLYNRYDNEVHPRESVADTISALNDHNDSLQDHIRFLSKRVSQLKKTLAAQTDDHQEAKDEKKVEEERTQPEVNEQESTGSTSESTSSLTCESLNEGDILKQARQEEEVPAYSPSDSYENLSMESLLEELPSFAVEWKSLRGVSQCSCGSPIDFLSRKFHCWNCGNVFCARCIDRQSSLPGHYSENKVPVCRPCHKLLK